MSVRCRDAVRPSGQDILKQHASCGGDLKQHDPDFSDMYGDKTSIIIAIRTAPVSLGLFNDLCLWPRVNNTCKDLRLSAVNKVDQETCRVMNKENVADWNDRVRRAQIETRMSWGKEAFCRWSSAILRAPNPNLKVQTIVIFPP